MNWMGLLQSVICSTFQELHCCNLICSFHQANSVNKCIHAGAPGFVWDLFGVMAVWDLQSGKFLKSGLYELVI